MTHGFGSLSSSATLVPPFMDIVLNDSATENRRMPRIDLPWITFAVT